MQYRLYCGSFNFFFALFPDPDIFVVIYTLVLDTKYYIFLSLKFKIIYYTIINLH